MKKFLKEFKTFITRGNVLDMAVAVIVGAAFNKIVSSLVADIITPLISLALGKVDFTELKLILRQGNEAANVAELSLNYGTFIQYIIDFLIIALTIFVVVKGIAKAKEALDFNANMTKIVQEKLDKDEQLTKVEAKWLKKYAKKHPDAAPVKKTEAEPEKEEPKEPTEAELLKEILAELRRKNEVETAEK